METVEDYYKRINISPGEAIVLPELDKPSFIGKTRRNIFKWMTIDSLLFSLRASYRESWWIRVKGIDDDQVYAYRLFTKFMTKDEKYNPQRMTLARVDELSRLSKICSNDIHSLIVLFHMRYRSNYLKNRRVENFILDTLYSSKTFIDTK